MSTAKRKILRSGSVFLALILTACAGPALLDKPVQEPKLLSLAPKPGFALHGVPIQHILFALSDRTESVRTFRGHTDLVNSVVFSPDGHRALSGSSDNTLRLWDLATGKTLRTFKGHWSSVNSVAISPDGRRALSGSGDDTLRLWDLATGKTLRTFKGHTDWVSSVAISPDGRRALSGSGGFDNTLRLWDLATGKILRTFEGHKWRVSAVAISPDGRRAFSGSNDDTLRLWDLATGKILRTFEGHAGWVRGVAISPDGRLALSASTRSYYPNNKKKVLRLWDINTGKKQRNFKGHTDSVTSVAFSPDGRRALSGSNDKTLRLWDINTGKLLRSFKGHTNAVTSVAFSPDGRRALSSNGNILLLWQVVQSIQPSLNPEQLQVALHKKASQHLEQRLEDFAGPLVSAPALPSVQIYSRDPFETKEMFDERMESTKTERARQISSIEKQYRSAVKTRNAKLQKFKKILETEHLSFYINAFKEVYGHPLLEVLTDAQGEPKYDPDKQRLYLSFRHQNAEETQEWGFQVPPGAPARELYQALKEGWTTASAHYLLKENSFVLDAVYAHHAGTRYPGVPARTEDYAPQEAVAVIFGEADALRDLRQQNPEFKAVQFEEFLVRERKTFDDDIPQLLRRAHAAKIDPRKWLFVIGVEKYRETNNIAFARRSAELFAQVASKSLGIHKHQKRILLDDDASSGAIEDNLKKLLQEVGKGDSIYLYYSGHGIPVPDKGDEPYILPADKIPQFIGDNEFYRVNNIYKALQSSKARQVFLFMDSCFTGQADDRPVIKDVANAVIRPKKLHISKNGKLAVLTAGTEDQFSNAYSEKGHRMFSYFLMRQLLSGHKTFGALALQVTAQVADQTKGFGSQKQNPVALGNPELQL